MDSKVTASTSVAFSEEPNEQELQLAWRTGEKTNDGLYVYLTPVIDAEVDCSEGSLSGGSTYDEEDEPEYVLWDGTRYGLSIGNVDVKATIFKVFDGNPDGPLTVDMDKLEIKSNKSFMGIVKIDKNNESKRYLWKPTNVDEESTAIVWAYYEGDHPVTKKKIKSSAMTEVSWPHDEKTYALSLSVGRQDNKEGCVWIYQTPNVYAVTRGTDVGSLSVEGTVLNKTKDIYTVWTGNSISLPDGCVSCSISVYKTYSGSSGGITVDLSEGVARSKESWNGIVKLSTVTESKKLKWSPPDVEQRTQAVVHAYRKGAVSMVNVEWKPNDSDYDIRIELGTKGSKEGQDLTLKELKLRMYPALDDAVLGCTEGSVRRGEKIIEDKTQYLEFQLVPLPEIHGTNEIAWEPDDPIDASDVSKVSLGKGLLEPSFEILDCFDRFGNAVEPEIYYDEDSGNAVGDTSFYGLVKATYKEEYQELIYQQAYSVASSGIMSILTGYVYARIGEKAAFCEVPWDTNLPSEKKDLYWIFSYYVTASTGTFEYPDNWMYELEGEIADLDKKTYADWEDILESRDVGTFAIDEDIEVSPSNCSVEKRVHRTASYDFIGNVTVENSQPIRGNYYKPYQNVKPSPSASYTPKYFIKFAGPPEVYDNIDEFGEQDYVTDSEFKGKEPLFIPTDDSKEQLKIAWKGTYARFDQNKIFEKMLIEFPGLIRIPPEE